MTYSSSGKAPGYAIAIDFGLLLSRRRPRRRILMALERVLITGGSGFLGSFAEIQTRT